MPVTHLGGGAIKGEPGWETQQASPNLLSTRGHTPVGHKWTSLLTPGSFRGSHACRPRFQMLTRHKAYKPRPQVSQSRFFILTLGRGACQPGVKLFVLEADSSEGETQLSEGHIYLFIYLSRRVFGGGVTGLFWGGKQAGGRQYGLERTQTLARCPSMFQVSATVAHAATQGAAPPCGDPEQNWLDSKQASTNLILSILSQCWTDLQRDLILPTDSDS